MVADETNLYSIDDGIKWLENIFNLKSKNWFFYLILFLKIFPLKKNINLQLFPFSWLL